VACSCARGAVHEVGPATPTRGGICLAAADAVPPLLLVARRYVSNVLGSEELGQTTGWLSRGLTGPWDRQLVDPYGARAFPRTGGGWWACRASIRPEPPPVE